jgi:hypothetical protein
MGTRRPSKSETSLWFIQYFCNEIACDKYSRIEFRLARATSVGPSLVDDVSTPGTWMGPASPQPLGMDLREVQCHMHPVHIVDHLSEDETGLSIGSGVSEF